MQVSSNTNSAAQKEKTAFIFPGQGSQAVGMGKDLFDNFKSARGVFAEADEALGISLSEMCFGGTIEELSLTENTQPAILTVSVAAYRAMLAEGFAKPDFVAGHSLGEYSALVAAGALEFAEAVKTVRMRGRYMQQAVPVGEGAMAAILGLDPSGVEKVCEEAADGQICSSANINSPAQIVIAGNAEAIDRACEIAKARGAKRAIKLNVSAPFHCALMNPAQEMLAKDLQNLEYGEFDFPIVRNFDSAESRDRTDVCRALTEQVSSPVRWLQSIELLIENGVENFVEVGTGKVLTGLVRQINREAKCLNVENSESLKSALANLQG